MCVGVGVGVPIHAYRYARHLMPSFFLLFRSAYSGSSFRLSALLRNIRWALCAEASLPPSSRRFASSLSMLGQGPKSQCCLASTMSSAHTGKRIRRGRKGGSGKRIGVALRVMLSLSNPPTPHISLCQTLWSVAKSPILPSAASNPPHALPWRKQVCTAFGTHILAQAFTTHGRSYVNAKRW